MVRAAGCPAPGVALAMLRPFAGQPRAPLASVVDGAELRTTAAAGKEISTRRRPAGTAPRAGRLQRCSRRGGESPPGACSRRGGESGWRGGTALHGLAVACGLRLAERAVGRGTRHLIHPCGAAGERERAAGSRPTFSRGSGCRISWVNPMTQNPIPD